MSNDEPGTGPEGQEPEKRGRGENPFAGTPFESLWESGALSGLGGDQPTGEAAAMFEQFRLQMQSMMSGQPSEGPIDWNLASDMAKVTIRSAGDASLTAAERAEVVDAVRLAEHWLDGVTSMPASSAGAVAWNRAEWLEQTQPTWRRLVDPLATHIVKAMGNALPPEAQSIAGPFGELMERAGGMMFGVQVGQGLGQIATEVCGASDIGIPLGPKGQPALVPANVAAFGEGLELPADDVRLYLALRECAHQRLVHSAPWLPSHLISAVEEYARGMHVDLSKFEDRFGGIDLNNPEALQEALGSGVLEPEETPRQKAALARLETALALVEGWVDDVVMQAAGPRLPSAARLQEAVRRRRAEGGPAEQTFSTLVGLELRPRRLRDAAALWAALRNSRGAEGRDALWEHPDMLPTSEDLDDPLGFVEASGESVPLDIAGIEDLPPHGSDQGNDHDKDDKDGGKGGQE